MDAVKTTQTALLTEVQEQSAKFGDDVKYLVTKTRIQISRKIWNSFFSNIRCQMMII